MTSLTAIFGSSSEKPEEEELESEKLHNLYWNRAELKKEFAELKHEKLRLQERIAEQEGAAARSQQQLQQLEDLLLDPGQVFSAVTCYQLRALNLKCAAKIARFAEKLKQQREQKVHSKQLEIWRDNCLEKSAGIEARLGEQRIQTQMLEDRLQSERNRLATMSGLVRLFRGRSARASLEDLAEKIHAAEANESAMLRELEELRVSEPPDTTGLDIATKRSINFMILAFAQKLYLLLRQHDVAELAMEAGVKSAAALNYGDKVTCERILDRICRSRESLAEKHAVADEMQTRAQRIAGQARFQSADDAVPISSTVATVFDIQPDGTVREYQQDLLADDYWGLAGVVSR